MKRYMYRSTSTKTTRNIKYTKPNILKIIIYIYNIIMSFKETYLKNNATMYFNINLELLLKMFLIVLFFKDHIKLAAGYIPRTGVWKE